MKKFLNIAVFGLSLNLLDQLKSQILLSVPREAQVRWVNIAEKNIDLLMVNDAFLLHPAFKKFSRKFIYSTYVSLKFQNNRA